MTENWLLMKRGVYWRPDRCGYTGLKREAGRYAEAEAKALCDAGESRMVRESEAPDYAPCCDKFVMVDDMALRLAAVEARQNSPTTEPAHD